MKFEDEHRPVFVYTKMFSLDEVEQIIADIEESLEVIVIWTAYSKDQSRWLLDGDENKVELAKDFLLKLNEK
jgi:hypothetical protein